VVSIYLFVLFAGSPCCKSTSERKRKNLDHNIIMHFGVRTTGLVRASADHGDNLFLYWQISILNKPRFGLNPKRYRSIVIASYKGGGAGGFGASYGLANISRYHHLTMSAGARLGGVPSVFLQIGIFFFPFRSVALSGLTGRVHGKLILAEIWGLPIDDRHYAC